MRKIKKIVWIFILPLHDIVRDTLLALKLLKHDYRDNYYIGHLHPERQATDLVNHLKSHGFDDHHFPSWPEHGELIHLRLLENFDFQYHLRIFQDREIRGHYEVAPESRPIAHVLEWHMEPRYEHFLEILEGWIIQKPKIILASGNTKSQSAPAASRGSPIMG